MAINALRGRFAPCTFAGGEGAAGALAGWGSKNDQSPALALHSWQKRTVSPARPPLSPFVGPLASHRCAATGVVSVQSIFVARSCLYTVYSP